MKKTSLLAVLSSVALALGFSSCTVNVDDTPAVDGTTTTTSTDYNPYTNTTTTTKKTTSY